VKFNYGTILTTGEFAHWHTHTASSITDLARDNEKLSLSTKPRVTRPQLLQRAEVTAAGELQIEVIAAGQGHIREMAISITSAAVARAREMRSIGAQHRK
jgi:hypothetical protein